MAVRMMRIDARNPSPAALDAAAAVLGRGGIVALPTETYYGLAVDPEHARAVHSLFLLKRRPADKAVPILLSRRSQVSGLARPPLPAVLDRVAAEFWPGPLTVLLPVRAGYPPEALGGGGRIALRVTSNPVARAVIDRFGAPVTGTSANRSGRSPASEAGEIVRQLGEGPELILDAGPSPGGLPSTLLDLGRKPYRILRPGAVPSRALRAVLGRDLA